MSVLYSTQQIFSMVLNDQPDLRCFGWPSDWIVSNTSVSLHMSPPGGAGSQCSEAGRRQEGEEAEQGHGSLSLDECLNCESMFL